MMNTCLVWISIRSNCCPCDCACLQVFRQVDRADFMTFCDDHDVLEAYEDHAWRSGKLHLSAPCIYTRAMEALQLSRGECTYMRIVSVIHNTCCCTQCSAVGGHSLVCHDAALRDFSYYYVHTYGIDKNSCVP